RIEEMRAAGLSVEETARRLGRHRSTVHRELRRCAGGYGAAAAQAGAERRARRPKAPKLAADAALAAGVSERLDMGWSPHAASADLAEAGLRVRAETIYLARYDDTGRRGHRGARPPAGAPPQDPRLGPGPRDGPLGRHRGRPRHRGVLLRAPLALAAPHQRADQRPAPPLAAQRHRPQRRRRAPVHHRGPPRHHAPQTPPLALSTERLHCPQSQPPVELAPVHPRHI
ncbi:MAG: helix-turn-helix domain-containing protein, partial [Acidimicrobiia bacterium]|nr:helix-turn-helix domain-containing protein [Acidimicrobiia bacterium]